MCVCVFNQFSCMDLPRELRQLSDFHKQRRERAVQKFKMNEDGLLIRTLMDTVERKVARKKGNQRGDTGFIPSNQVASSETFSATSVHLSDSAGQEGQLGEGRGESKSVG